MRTGMYAGGVTAVAAATAAAVVGVSSVVSQVVATPPAVDWPVDLSAVVTPGSATNWNATGIDKFYGLDWNTMPGPSIAGPSVYGPTVVATFHLLRDYIQVAAIDTALKTNPEPNIVVSSGRGAGNASALISQYAENGDPTLLNTNWILDNNIDRPNGGYGARYTTWSLGQRQPDSDAHRHRGADHRRRLRVRLELRCPAVRAQRGRPAQLDHRVRLPL